MQTDTGKVLGKPRPTRLLCGTWRCNIRRQWRLDPTTTIVKDATFLINKGSGCGGSTPDCDIVSGAISQCPTTSYTGESNKTSVGNPVFSVDPASPAHPEASMLKPTSGLAYTEVFRRKNRARAEVPEG